MKRKIGKAIIFFFAAMFCCTLIARGASGALIAKVETDQVRKGNLSSAVSGSGNIQVKEVSHQFLPEGQKVKTVYVKTGTLVAGGQDLIQLDESYLQELTDEASRNLEKLKLQLEQQEIQGQAQARTPETASALIALHAAEEAVQKAQTAYEQAVKEVQDFAAIPPAADASQEEIDQWNQTVESMNEKARGLADEIDNQNSAYKQAVEQYNLAQQNEENTRRNQEQETLANQKALESTKVDVQAAEEKLKKLQEIQEGKAVVKAQADGLFLSAGVSEGTITTGSEQLDIAVGAFQAVGRISSGDGGKIEPGDEIEVKYSGASQSVTLTVERLEPVVSSGNQPNNEQGNGTGDEDAGILWYAQIQDASVQLGTAFTYEVIKSTDVYQQIIPLSALREINGLAYVMTVEEKDGILGKNYTAVKVPVTILGKDGEKAAVESTLDASSLIITSSNKYVEEGDPVRFKE